MKQITFIILLLPIISCQKERITIGEKVNETFYVQNDELSMRVQVRGNTTSKTFLVVVHGGPGGTSYAYQLDAVREIIEPEFAVVYWDQRVSGASQGGSVQSLRVEQFGEDLKKVIQAIQYRYGPDASVFILGHSWGGMVTASFITTGDNQRLIKGWMYVNASHNYPLNDSLTRTALLTFGSEEIRQQRNVNKWQNIIRFCEENPDVADYDFTTHQQMNAYAWEAIGMIEGFTPLNDDAIIRENLIKERIPFTSAFVNLINPAMKNLEKVIQRVEFSSQLHKVTVPVLVCAGSYDFVCPAGLGDDLFNRISSVKKEKLLFTQSAHNIEETAAYSAAFVRFIQENR